MSSEESEKFISLVGSRVETIKRQGLDGVQWEKKSGRWIELFYDQGALTVSGGGTPDYESATIDVVHYDEIICEFELSTSTDLDFGVRLRDRHDAANLSGFNVRDYDTAAVLDLAAVFAETALDVSGGDQVHWYVLDRLIPLWKIKVYVENDDAVNAAAYKVRVFGRRSN